MKYTIEEQIWFSYEVDVKITHILNMYKES